jgi:diguanylate cyclase (GGDEF)-like protein/PAS domain S-box-containing protein
VEPSDQDRNDLGNGTPRGTDGPTHASGSPAEGDRWLRSVFENSSEIIKIVDPDGTLRYASPAFGRVLGYDPEAAVGTNVLDYVHPDDIAHVLEQTAKALDDGSIASTEAEYRFRHKDGSWRWVESVGTYLLDDPTVRGVVVNVRDVTQRKEAEAALKKNEAKFRAIFDRAATGMALVDAQGRIKESNPALQEMLGYAEEELRGKHFAEVTHPEDVAADTGLFERLLSGEIDHFRLEKRYVRKDGRTVWGHLTSSIVLSDGEDPQLMVGMVEDVTERKSAEETIKRLAHRNQLILDSAGEGIYGLDREGKTTFVNSVAAALVGFEPEELVGRDQHEVIHHSRPDGTPYPREECLIYAALTDGEIHHVDDEVFWRKDGTAFPIGYTSTPILEDGKIAGAVVTFTDVTERKEADEALREGEERYRAVMEQSVEAIYLYDAETKRILESNAAFRMLMGYTEKELLGMRIYDFIAHDGEDIDRHVERSLEQKRRQIGERRYRRKDGSAILVDTSASVISYGGRTALCAVSRDVTERREAEEAVRKSETRLAEAQRLAHLGGWEWDVRADEITWSDEVYRIYGLEPQSSVPSYEGFMAVVHSDDKNRVRKTIDEALDGSGPYDVEHRVVRPDGEVRAVHRQAKVVRGERGEPLRMIGTVHDITERKEAEERLRATEERYRQVVEAQTELVCRFLPDFTLTFANDAYCRYFGEEPEELVGNSFLEHIPVEDRAHYEGPSFRLSHERPTRTVEHRVLTADGEVRWQQWTDMAIFDAEGHVIEYQSVGRDVTERQALEERLEHQALHDSLTNLPNRRLFVDRLGQALRRTRRRKGCRVAVLFMDLDGFKVVNDSLGHDTGDRLLVEVAKRLGSCLRPEDTLARFGGDEFTVLIEDVEISDDAVRVAERIVEELREPISLDGRELYVATSIGVGLGNDSIQGSEELLREADTAMYRAKDEGSGYEVFDPAMHERAVYRLELENDLRRAIEENEFVVHYQPIVNLETGELWGMEALVRWEHPERGLLNPDEFVPVAEESGLVVPMGELVFEEACRRAVQWQREFPRTPPLAMSVNLSGRQLRRPDLHEVIGQALKETGLPASSLGLDITETVYISAMDANTAALDRLRALGIRISLDDFGSGYSSLSYLKRLPADILKIDQSFTKGLGLEVEDTAIVQTIVDLAHILGMEVVAEGVEIEEQETLLKEMGCDMAQGFYFARPLPPEEVPEFLDD